MSGASPSHPSALHALAVGTLSLPCPTGAVLVEPPSAADPSPNLLQRAAGGEADAVDELARWCYPRVYRWALVRSGDPDEADDVTQETMVSLVSHLGGYRGDARFATWLYRVTMNAATARERGRRRRLRLLSRWWRPERAAVPAPLRDIHDADLAGLVRLLLRELPPQQRTVFDLTDLQGFSAPELADMLELDQGTIRSHLMRARRTMRARMLERLPTLAEDRP